MTNKGFTLIELIGVILILGIIVTIISVSVSGIISENQKKTLRLSTESMIKLKNNYEADTGNTSSSSCVITDIEDGYMTCFNEMNYDFDYEMKVNKNKYFGYIVSNEDGSSDLCISDGKYYVTGSIDNYEVFDVRDLDLSGCTDIQSCVCSDY